MKLRRPPLWNASTFEGKETNSLEIENHEVDETFDFSRNEEWK